MKYVTNLNLIVESYNEVGTFFRFLLAILLSIFFAFLLMSMTLYLVIHSITDKLNKNKNGAEYMFIHVTAKFFQQKLSNELICKV